MKGRSALLILFTFFSSHYTESLIIRTNQSRILQSRSFPKLSPNLHRQINTRNISKLHMMADPMIKDWTPLYMSTIAGLSTCIGAAIVFSVPKVDDKRIVPPGLMAFSLALAGRYVYIQMIHIFIQTFIILILYLQCHGHCICHFDYSRMSHG